jgi:hypothetical protein
MKYARLHQLREIYEIYRPDLPTDIMHAPDQNHISIRDRAVTDRVHTRWTWKLDVACATWQGSIWKARSTAVTCS